MQKISDLRNFELKWVQPHAMKMEYELQAGMETAATLHFRSSWGTFATAESADGCWTFKRVGFWQNRASIRRCDEEIDLANFKNNTWKGGGTLELPDGQKILATTNVWQSELAFKTEQEEVIFKLHTGGFVHLSVAVTPGPRWDLLTQYPWMLMLSLYLVVMMQRDGATAAVASGS
jgi:hypothetical protein